MNFARAGLYAHQGAAAIEITLDVMLIERALHQHFVICDHRARTRGPIECEWRVAGPDIDIARAGLQGPCSRGCACSLDIARAGLCMETAMNILDLDVARSCLRLHISLTDLLRGDISGSGFHR